MRCSTCLRNHLLGILDLRDQNQVRRFGHNFVQILESQRQHWLMRTMRSAVQEINRTQRVAHQQSRSIFFCCVDRVLQIENDGIWFIQRRIDEIFRLAARQVQAASGACDPALDASGQFGIRSGQNARLPSPNPARRTAASTRAAITNGSAPSSRI